MFALKGGINLFHGKVEKEEYKYSQKLPNWIPANLIKFLSFLYWKIMRETDKDDSYKSLYVPLDQITTLVAVHNKCAAPQQR